MTTDAQGNEICKLFVGGLHQNTNNDSLRLHFSRYGHVEEAVVMIDNSTGRSRGFGYVKFISDESIEKVLSVNKHFLDDKEIDPKRCNVYMKGKNRRSLKIFVGGIAPEVNEEQVKLAFSNYGTVTDVNLMTDQTKQRHRGFAFVSFENEAIVKSLIQMHHITIAGKQTEIKPMEPPNSRRQNSFPGFTHYSSQAFYPGVTTSTNHPAYTPHYFTNGGHSQNHSRHLANDCDMAGHVGRNSYYDYASIGPHRMMMHPSHYASMHQQGLTHAQNNLTEMRHMDPSAYDMGYEADSSTNNQMSGPNLWPNSGVPSNWSQSMNWQTAQNYNSQQWSELINGTAGLLISSNANDHASSNGAVNWIGKFPGADDLVSSNGVTGGRMADSAIQLSLNNPSLHAPHQQMGYGGEFAMWSGSEQGTAVNGVLGNSSALPVSQVWSPSGPVNLSGTSTILCHNHEGQQHNNNVGAICKDGNSEIALNNSIVEQGGSPPAGATDHVNSLSLLNSSQTGSSSIANSCANSNINVNFANVNNNNHNNDVSSNGSNSLQLTSSAIGSGNLSWPLIYGTNSLNNLASCSPHAAMGNMGYQNTCSSVMVSAQQTNR